MNKTVHESGQLHVTGHAKYIDDINVPANTLTGYVVTSKVAAGVLTSFNTHKALAIPGVHAVLAYTDIPGHNQMGAIVKDEPILVGHEIQFIGQALFLIAANSEQLAKQAEKALDIVVEEKEPVLTIQAAQKKDLKIAPTLTMERGNPEKAFKQCAHVLEDTITSGAQEHWYLETQVALAIPGEEDDMKVYSSTQHPSETQTLIAEALGLGKHQVEVETRRLGGAFGGKETQANMIAIWSSLLANKTQKPVKIRLFRDDDQKMTGKRHPFVSTYKIGFDELGKINAYQVHFHANAGYSADLSMPILARARTHADNAYFIPNIKIESTAWRTNLPSNTAFRGFGAPQSIFTIESAIEKIAQHLNKDAAEIRYLNFYRENSFNITPFDEVVENNRLMPIWNKLIKTSDYFERRKKVGAFNKTNKYTKRGISLIPVKFGISFNTPHLNQAGALINIYTDGTVLVNHGGIEMGQGLHTKIKQVVALELGIGKEQVKINATNTSKVPNTSATAASSGTDLNGMAAKNATDKLKKRITKFLANKWSKSNPEIPTKPKNIVFKEGIISDVLNPERNLTFHEVINELYLNRISLSAQGFYSTPNLHFDRKKQKGRPFHYFAFGMSISEVELDLLTGMHRILRTDILHDAGSSINKHIDIGQIQGAFVQAVGWCTTEECKWDNKGNLLNHSPDTYKIPGIRDIPEVFNVELLENMPNPNTIKKSKAVGEPPFIHGLSVLFALQEAINTKGNRIQLPIPATHEKIVLALNGK